MAFGFGAGIQRLGSVAADTLSALNAISPGTDVRPTGFVYNDGTVANNGVYTWSGTVWVKQRGLPDGMGSYAGASGSNTITATLASGVDPAQIKAALLIPAANNTGAATLNGEALKDRSGNALASGALVAGAAVLLMRDGSTWRVMNGNIAEISDVSGLQAILDTKFDAGSLDDDETFAADDPARVASQRATKSYIDTAISAIKGGVSSAFDTLAEVAADLATKATTTYVDGQISALKGGVSTAFDTLSEIATELATKATSAALTSGLAGKQAAHAILTALSGLTNAAGVLANDGAGNLTWGAPVAPVDRQVFTGNGTWTKPAQGTMAFIRLWDGGSSGERGSSGPVAGGPGGRYAERWLPLSALGSTEPVVVGAGGASRTTNGTSNAGGPSSFGSWLTSIAGLTLPPHWSPGAGGSTSIGGPSFLGGAGGGAGGGSSAGGTSYLGGGNGGAGSNNSGVGAGAGVAPGGGGGGSVVGTSGAGARGQVEVIVF